MQWRFWLDITIHRVYRKQHAPFLIESKFRDHKKMPSIVSADTTIWSFFIFCRSKPCATTEFLRKKDAFRTFVCNSYDCSQNQSTLCYRHKVSVCHTQRHTARFRIDSEFCQQSVIYSPAFYVTAFDLHSFCRLSHALMFRIKFKKKITHTICRMKHKSRAEFINM